jgi:transaldolase
MKVRTSSASATFISPYLGRLDDGGQDGIEMIREIRAIYDTYDFDTENLADSISTPLHGADCATIPSAVFKAPSKHVQTDVGLEGFLNDCKASGRGIL